MYCTACAMGSWSRHARFWAMSRRPSGSIAGASAPSRHWLPPFCWKRGLRSGSSNSSARNCAGGRLFWATLSRHSMFRPKRRRLTPGCICPNPGEALLSRSPAVNAVYCGTRNRRPCGAYQCGRRAVIRRIAPGAFDHGRPAECRSSRNLGRGLRRCDGTDQNRRRNRRGRHHRTCDCSSAGGGWSEVVVLDQNEPGLGASYGNAGAIAPYCCAPHGTPDVLRNLRSLLFDSESPLAIRPAALPALLPWLSRFVWQSMPARARRNGYALAGLLKDAMPAWRDLAMQAEASSLFRHEGCLYFYRERMPPRNSEWGARLRDELGVR